VGVVGGIAGLVTLAVYRTPTLALVQIGSFSVWGSLRESCCFDARALEAPSALP
jgi:hypothetical protein